MEQYQRIKRTCASVVCSKIGDSALDIARAMGSSEMVALLDPASNHPASETEIDPDSKKFAEFLDMNADTVLEQQGLKEGVPTRLQCPIGMNLMQVRREASVSVGMHPRPYQSHNCSASRS
jgi:hypothetical protein